MIDLTKPVQTACGYPARVLATDRRHHLPVTAFYTRGGEEWPLYLNSDGYCLYNPGLSLVNAPEPKPFKVTLRMTVEDAARLGEKSMRFCRMQGLAEMASYEDCLAHFTALAEQQREEG